MPARCFRNWCIQRKFQISLSLCPEDLRHVLFGKDGAYFFQSADPAASAAQQIRPGLIIETPVQKGLFHALLILNPDSESRKLILSGDNYLADPLTGADPDSLLFLLQLRDRSVLLHQLAGQHFCGNRVYRFPDCMDIGKSHGKQKNDQDNDKRHQFTEPCTGIFPDNPVEASADRTERKPFFSIEFQAENSQSRLRQEIQERRKRRPDLLFIKKPCPNHFLPPGKGIT